MDAPIRPVSIAEHAMHAAALTAMNHEIQPNPHEAGTPAHARWKAAYERYLLQHTAAEVEGGA